MIWLWFVLMLVLAEGCAPGEMRHASCREAFAVLLPEQVIDAIDEHTTSVVVTGGRHVVECRFGRDTASGPALLQLTLDGEMLSPINTQLLRRVLRLPTPPELLEPPRTSRSRLGTVAYVLQQLVNGISLGAVLGLVAVGYALVYGITGTIQFAYGELYMIGAVLVAGFCLTMPSLAVTILLAASVTAVYGWSAERLVWRHLRDRSTFACLVAAIGLSIALREYVRLAQGSNNKWLPPIIPGNWRIPIGPHEVLVGHAQLLALGLGACLAVGLAWALSRTHLGRAWRACADDPGAAALVGVDVAKTISAAFVTGAALAAIAGAAVAVQYGEADFAMGYLMGFKALAAALLGGFGSIAGAFLGAVIMGLFEAGWSAAFGLAWKDAAVFGLLVLVLVFRPQGIIRGRAGDSAPALPRRE